MAFVLAGPATPSPNACYGKSLVFASLETSLFTLNVSPRLTTCLLTSYPADSFFAYSSSSQRLTLCSSPARHPWPNPSPTPFLWA